MNAHACTHPPTYTHKVSDVIKIEMEKELGVVVRACNLRRQEYPKSGPALVQSERPCLKKGSGWVWGENEAA